MSPFLAEFLSTTRLVLGGDGVVANVLVWLTSLPHSPLTEDVIGVGAWASVAP